MADVNRASRPLSPHLGIYRPQITSVLSIVHRATGVGLAAGVVLLVWWFLAAASGPEYFAFADGLITSWIGHLVMIAVLWSLCYHFSNGLRHLWWDLGRGYELESVTLSGQVAVVASGVLTIFVMVVGSI